MSQSEMCIRLSFSITSSIPKDATQLILMFIFRNLKEKETLVSITSFSNNSSICRTFYREKLLMKACFKQAISKYLIKQIMEFKIWHERFSTFITIWPCWSYIIKVLYLFWWQKRGRNWGFPHNVQLEVLHFFLTLYHSFFFRLRDVIMDGLWLTSIC